jgi:uncharacterized protein
MLCTSSAITNELERVLVERFEWEPRDMHAILGAIFCRAELVKPNITVFASSDPDDNGILECALASQSDVIVTGDDDLLRLQSFRNIKIIKPREFLNILLQIG